MGYIPESSKGPDGSPSARPSWSLERGLNGLVREPALIHAAGTPTAAATIAARFRYLMETAPVAAFVKDADGHFLHANPHMLATIGMHMGPNWRGKTAADFWPPDLAARDRASDQAVLREGTFKAYEEVMTLESEPHTFLFMKFPLVTDDGRVNLGVVSVDLTSQSEQDAERERIATAMQQVTESVMITDLQCRIVYVNHAFELVTGYSREEVVGQNPRFLKSGVHPRSFFEEMWAALGAGLPWASTDMVNRRKDGSLFTEDAIISPMRDAADKITGYVAVKHDVTPERALAERSSKLIRERALIAETIIGLRASDTPEVTAQAICRQVARLPGIAATQLLHFELDGHAIPIGFFVVGHPDPPLQRLPYQRSRQLFIRAKEGPWVQPWASYAGHPYTELLTGVGVRSLGYAPVRYDSRLIGLLVIQATDTVDKAATTEALPALAEFADLAGALVGRELAKRTDTGRVHDDISGVISRRAFRPVFQPIVELEGGAVVGFEALTRFADNAVPEIAFAEAAAVGLGLDLERATLHAALAASKSLPASAWLNLNASPELIMAGEMTGLFPRRSKRRIVLEVTEHSVVADYPAFLAAVSAIGLPVDLAVDDAGAGFSSLRHILELHPAFVKLDRSLVLGLEADKVRQAMIAGLKHFARDTGCRLIAEGIETDAELAALRSLDIRLGQGYLLGRPLPIDKYRDA